MDPLTRDATNPARLVELTLQSEGARLNGILYLPAGPGPHGVVALLHGNPGNERNLDLAQALRRAGYGVLFFNYRGSWGSGGTFSRAHALEDAHAALNFLRSPTIRSQYRIDSARVALIGHSMGGWIALLTAAADRGVRCVAALDFVNTGARGRRLQRDAAYDSATVAEYEALTAPGGPYRTEGGGAALVAEMKMNADTWDVIRSAPALRSRPVLLIAAVNGAEQDSLVASMGGSAASQLTAQSWKTDHSFSDRRVGLARTIVDWIRGPCGL
jgi:pimeloyl-ACP methyl ester carboxylesterase